MGVLQLSRFFFTQERGVVAQNQECDAESIKVHGKPYEPVASERKNLFGSVTAKSVRRRSLTLISDLATVDRERVESRLRHNLIAWLTTVRADGQPVTVPVWFLLQEDETFLLYSQPESAKFRNISANSKVSLALDVCDLGRNIVRLEGTAAPIEESPTALAPAYLAKYTERIAALFDSPERFAEMFSRALIITPTKLHVD
jgi:PPOX class probable F420-dependent enzyme